ncbi:MAG TPA: IS481 family transposase [Methylomirabilota bacterium]|nr:IS481 family transposase [Methylomirabilota bacterium]
MMGQTAKEREQGRRAQARLRVLRHYEQVPRNVSQTCRFFGISRTLFYRWRERCRQDGLVGLRDGPRGPRYHPFTTPPHIVALILEIRRERQYGPLRIRFFLERYHQVYVSATTIHRILKQHRVPRVSLKRYRPGPRRRREIHVPGQSVQVDVKHLKLGGRRFYQFTAIDEATRYRVLRVYAQNSIKSATDFVEEVRRRLPVAIQRIQTDHGSEFGTDFTWHLRDLGVSHRQIPRGCPESNGKVERSHRTDADEFYRRMIFRSPAELARKLRQWEHEYNHRRPHLALRGQTPAERLCELRIACDPVQQLA